MANPLYEAMPTTIFAVMTGLARDLGAINLGQGFPDESGPLAIRQKAADATLNGDNQYPPTLRPAGAARGGGRPLRRASRVSTWTGRSEVTVTSGGTEALAACLPRPDRAGRRGGAVPAALRLLRCRWCAARAACPASCAWSRRHWRFDRAMLEAAFTERTRLVVLNNPLNPTATVCPDEDLALLAEFCVRHDAVAVCDEVWEHVVFDGRAHRPLMALPGMRERTVKIGSAGKMFALTGWKVGFLCAAPTLDRGAGQGAPVPHLHHPAEPAGGGGLGPGQQRRLVRRHAGRPRPLARPADRGAPRPRASPCSRARAPISSTSTWRPPACARTTWPSACAR